ncbi:protein DENND6A [Anthonomus grandis grandis]|uniref:protein DENND6A n=1 Tax=Anthonomus grandis grandis TaxID=2921223 RepID=UPI002165F932|nr:protein DENND6A [Anthonomus grandis grandis]
MWQKFNNTDGRNSIDTTELLNENVWEHFNNWLHCICVVAFDLELGQALEIKYPKHVELTEQEVSNICYSAFPDSNSGCMGDTKFIIRLPCKNKRELRSEHVKYNAKCPPALRIDEGYMWGFVYFRQVRDPNLPRGYFQKSVVLLSYLPFNNLFTELCNYIAPEYFEHGEKCLEAVCMNIERWPPPVPGKSIALFVLGQVFQTYIPDHTTLRGNEIGENKVLTKIDDLNLFELFKPVLSHIHLLWELVITSEPIVVMASSPTNCSLMVLALTRLISPLQFCGDYRPYFTIHDSEFKQYKQYTLKERFPRLPPPAILGVTNPFFAKTFQHWPHTIILNDDLGRNSKYKIKKPAQAKQIETSSGIYTSYKPFLQKDKNIIKKLMSGVNSNRPDEAQSAMLRKHLLELTHSFMIPLERYIASLMPLQKDISAFKAAPIPNPFNPENFFTTLETAGPHLTLNKTNIKGDWIGLYRKFFRSRNFNSWYNWRYQELSQKLQALHTEALSNADLKNWVQDRPEVEVVDMVLRIKTKIIECENNIPVSENVKRELNQRMLDVVTSLPDDLKNILKIS